MNKLNREAYEAFAGSDWPSYQDYIDNKISSKLIEKELKELEKQSSKINISYDYNSTDPLHINVNNLTNEQKYKLTESKSFCLMPWIHLYSIPSGKVYPCCTWDHQKPIGDMRSNTMVEIWNAEEYKNLRRNMINDNNIEACCYCYEREKNGAFSLRNEINRTYAHHVNEIEKTLEDGTHPEFKIRYWDIRFSNLCNFSCRTCTPICSSNWFNDYIKLKGEKPTYFGKEMARVEYVAGDEDTIMAQMLPHIPYLEQVYFAGGEPLIMKEHYFMLEKLIELGKTDIRLQYNTNFSELRYKDQHVFDYWKHFKNVSVGASLDASGERAELLRKGTVWQQTLDNRKRMIKEVPHVDFYVSATVSAMNVLHVIDFHREWVELGLIEPKDFNINLCQNPEWYRPNIFPQWFKDEKIIPSYNKHLEWITPLDPLKRATNGFVSLLNFIKTKNTIQNLNVSDEFEMFKVQINKLDGIRNENFWKVFPELNELA